MAKRDAWMKQIAADINFAIEEITLQETVCAGIKTPTESMPQRRRCHRPRSICHRFSQLSPPSKSRLC